MLSICCCISVIDLELVNLLTISTSSKALHRCSPALAHDVDHHVQETEDPPFYDLQEGVVSDIIHKHVIEYLARSFIFLVDYTVRKLALFV